MTATRAPDTVRPDAYDELVADRIALGEELYGNRHLHRDDLLDNLLQEIADCHVWLTLEARRWRRQNLAAAGGLGSEHRLLLVRVVDFGALAEQTCRSIDPDAIPRGFAQPLAERNAYGEQTGGESFLAKDCLSEALEEIADVQILTLLEADRRTHNGELAREVRAALDRLDADADGIGRHIVALRDARDHMTH